MKDIDKRLDKKIENILENYSEYSSFKSHDALYRIKELKLDSRDLKTSIKNIKSLISDICDEVIGEDGIEYNRSARIKHYKLKKGQTGIDVPYCDWVTRDALRVEQRQRKDRSLGKVE